ncbi:hypothetical protein, partial [Halorubrum lacusprofundi]|uniref:hypothetical protein n=1 Tax=Halorubrum lacusprofundi TaxID=2247 RepID=UPI001A8EC4EB
MIDDLSNGVHGICMRLIDDSVGAGLKVASYIDEAVGLGLSTGDRVRRRPVNPLEITSDFTGSGS